MNLNCHILLGLLLLPFYLIFGKIIFIIIIASILIDIDHLQILFENNAFSLKKIKCTIREVNKRYNSHSPDSFNRQYFIFHSLEFNLLLILLSFLYKPLIFIFLGFSFHILCDLIHHSYFKLPIKRWIFLTEGIKRYLSEK